MEVANLVSRSPEATVEQEARFNRSFCGACLMAAMCVQVLDFWDGFGFFFFVST